MDEWYTSVKVIIWATNPGFINVLIIFSYFKNLPQTWLRQACQQTPPMGLVGTWYGVCWILLNCFVGEIYILIPLVYACFRHFKTHNGHNLLHFQSANLFLSNNDELRQQMSTYINIMRWDYSPTNPIPMCQLTPMISVYFMLLLQKAETIMTNHYSLTL